MRQHLNIREHSWRANAPLILIVALKSPRLPRYTFPFLNKLLPFLTESPRGCFGRWSGMGNLGSFATSQGLMRLHPAHIGSAEAARGDYLERNRPVRIAAWWISGSFPWWSLRGGGATMRDCGEEATMAPAGT